MRVCVCVCMYTHKRLLTCLPWGATSTIIIAGMVTEGLKIRGSHFCSLCIGYSRSHSTSESHSVGCAALIETDTMHLWAMTELPSRWCPLNRNQLSHTDSHPLSVQEELMTPTNSSCMISVDSVLSQGWGGKRGRASRPLLIMRQRPALSIQLLVPTEHRRLTPTACPTILGLETENQLFFCSVQPHEGAGA